MAEAFHYFYSICSCQVKTGSHLTLWFVVRWLITCVLLHFCTCTCPFSLWLEIFISTVCARHGCMTQEETFLDLWKLFWVWIKQPVLYSSYTSYNRSLVWLNTIENILALLPHRPWYPGFFFFCFFFLNKKQESCKDSLFSFISLSRWDTFFLVF